MEKAKPTAVLLLAYGTPDRLEDLKPFLERVRGGRPVSPELLEEVRGRYERIGGRSPLTDITRAQARALEEALGGAGGGFETFVGMRHWRPTIGETADEIHRRGIRDWIAVVMAPHESRLSTGAYRDRLEEEGGRLDPAPRILHVPSWHRHPLYLEAIAAKVREAIERFPERERDGIPVVLTAHSLPERIREWDDPYERQFRETAEGVMAIVGDRPWRTAYQSGGKTGEPWLGPDVGQVIDEIGREGVRGVVIAPVGFVADHIEVLYDLDIECRDRARDLGMRVERCASLNDDPTFIRALEAVVREAAGGAGSGGGPA